MIKKYIEKSAPGSDWLITTGQGTAPEACPRKEVLEFGNRFSSIASGPIHQSNSNTAHLERGSGRIENACGGITGRSPSFGDHPSGRQTRKHVWRSRSRVPAALFLGVLGSTWGLLGAFLGVLGRSWGLLGALGTLLGDLGAILP